MDHSYFKRGKNWVSCLHWNMSVPQDGCCTGGCINALRGPQILPILQKKVELIYITDCRGFGCRLKTFSVSCLHFPLMSVFYSGALFLSVTTTRTAWFSANTVSFSQNIPNLSFLFFFFLSSPSPLPPLRLERLVDVLRKKVGAGTIRTVIWLKALV